MDEAVVETVYDRHGVRVLHGDCASAMRAMEPSSVDSVVCDPPYGLEFMGRDWDKPWAVGMSALGYTDGSHRLARPSHSDNRNGYCRACKRRQRGHDRCTCDAPQWAKNPADDMRAFQSWCEAWAAECLRVLKPGGYLLAFGGTRTFHRLASGIEDAGFEIRDDIGVAGWTYGAGFPKSLDVGKAIDRARDDKPATLAVTAFVRDARDRAGLRNCDIDAALGVTAMADLWCRQSPMHARVPTLAQWDQLRALLGFGDEMDEEVARLNGRKGEPGESWGERDVIGEWQAPGRGKRSTEQSFGLTANQGKITRAAQESSRKWEGWGTALKPAWEPIIVARKPLSGTVAANVLAHGTGALNIDGCRVVPTAGDYAHDGNTNITQEQRLYEGGRFQNRGQKVEPHGSGRWPADAVFLHHPDCGPEENPEQCHPDCQVAELDRQSGTLTTNPGTYRSGTNSGDGWGNIGVRKSGDVVSKGDSGGASRFFPTFRFEAKAPTSERPQVDGIAHPTVKPLALMRWLVRLVTQPGGTVLDCFAGSGSTGQAARAEGMRAVLIEREADYIPLIKARLDARQRTPAKSTGDVSGDEPMDLLDLLGDSA